jgi:hypothetical protein
MVRLCAEDGCEKKARTRGLCNAHYEYRRRRAGFEGILSPKQDVDRRYESKVDRSGGLDACHPWTASVNQAGYGHFRASGRMHLAHRWAYARFVVPLEDEEVVRHTCDNPPCQNPRHLLSGSVKDNVQDMMERGRAYDRRGAANSRAKLSEEQVLEIRDSSDSATALASRYGVSTQLISAIRLRQTWAHI